MDDIQKSSERKKVAKKIIKRRMFYAAGLGFIPVPIVDSASILASQILMIQSIANLYKVPFKQHRVKSFIGSLVGAIGTMSVIKAVPGLGSLIGGATMSLTGVASTYAIGKVFVQHFDQGGTLLDFDPVKSQKYFQEVYEKGTLKAERLQAKKSKKMRNVFNNSKLTTAETPNKASILRANHIKRLKAKRRRKTIKKWALGFILLLLLAVLSNWAYYNYIYNRADNTTIDIDLDELKTTIIDLEPAESLDSLTTATIGGFSPISTEGVIAEYIQQNEAAYPKRYLLSAVRFVGSSDELGEGAIHQLENLAFLMKKYPDLVVSLYGHASHTGPKLSRQRIGRERARILKDAFSKMGIPNYRVTGNYIEKSESVHNGYWGAEIVIDVATVESVVYVPPPSKPESTSIFDWLVGKEIKEIKDTEEVVDRVGFITKELPEGGKLTIPENGIESQIIDFIEDESRPIDKKTWFDFDRLTFTEGSINLNMVKSKEQLNNLVKIMKYFPKIYIKIGGYTDNTGSEKINLRISQKRADSVRGVLISKGIHSERIVSEGYGSQHPVASNDTEKGRRKNRRVSLRLTAK